MAEPVEDQPPLGAFPGQWVVELDHATWDVFIALLDNPARSDPRLIELFARPPRIGR